MTRETSVRKGISEPRPAAGRERTDAAYPGNRSAGQGPDAQRRSTASSGVPLRTEPDALSPRHGPPRIESSDEVTARSGRNTGRRRRARTSCGDGRSCPLTAAPAPALARGGTVSCPPRVTCISAESREALASGKRGAASTSNSWKAGLRLRVRKRRRRRELREDRAFGSFCPRLSLLRRQRPGLRTVRPPLP